MVVTAITRTRQRWLPIIAGLAVFLSGGLLVALALGYYLDARVRHAQATPLVHRGDSVTALHVGLVGLLIVVWGIMILARGKLYQNVPGPVSAGWSLTGLLWVSFAILTSSLGVNGDLNAELLRLTAPVLIAGMCFIRVTKPGSGWQIAQGARFARVMATCIAAYGVIDFVTFDATSKAVNEARTEFTRINDPYLLVSIATPGVTRRALDDAPWLLLASAYAVMSWNDLRRLFKKYLAALPWIGQAWSAADRHLIGLHPWLLFVAVLWLTFSIDPLGTADNRGDLRRAVELAPVYVILVLAAVGVFHALLAPGRSDAPRDNTDHRDDILGETKLLLWLLFVVAAVLFGSLVLLVWSGSEPAFAGFAVIVFVIIAIHYVLFVELPYGLGQNRWKSKLVREAENELWDAGEELAHNLASAVPSAPRGATLASERYTMDRKRARVALAEERVRSAKRVPVLSIKGVGDALVKTGGGSLVSGASALLASVQHTLAASSSSSGAPHDLLRVLLNNLLGGGQGGGLNFY